MNMNININNTNNKELEISEQELIARNESFLVIANHPKLPLYLTANTKSDIKLWHYLHEYPLATFCLPVSNNNQHNLNNNNNINNNRTNTNINNTTNNNISNNNMNKSNININDINRKKQNITNSSTTNTTQSNQAITTSKSSQSYYMTSIKFNSYGNKLCGISQNGNLYIWHFNVPRSIYRREFRAYYEQKCHDKFGNDLVFIRGSAMIGTVGDSTNNRNVCIWDILFSNPSRSLIRSYMF